LAGAIHDGKAKATGFSHSSEGDAIRRVMKASGGKPEGVVRSQDPHGLLRALHSIYSGKPSPVKLEIDLSTIGPLMQKIYSVVCRIPCGYAVTYKGVAKAVGSTKYARAVGYAMASNPFLLIIPCHRVVPSDLRPGHYGMGDRVKKQLLLREGVSFRGERIRPESIYKGL